MARPSGLRGVATVLLSQSLLRPLYMTRSIFWPLSLEILNRVIGGARCGTKYHTPEILVRLLPFLLTGGIKRRGGGAAQSRRSWLGLALNHLEHGLAVEISGRRAACSCIRETFHCSCRQRLGSS